MKFLWYMFTTKTKTVLCTFTHLKIFQRNNILRWFNYNKSDQLLKTVLLTSKQLINGYRNANAVYWSTINEYIYI